MHKVSTPIKFTTEAERLKAREQYVAIACTVNDARGREAEELAFDFAFPPIVPPKMVPFEAWLEVTEDGRKWGAVQMTKPGAWCMGHRIARVRVVEVDDE